MNISQIDKWKFTIDSINKVPKNTEISVEELDYYLRLNNHVSIRFYHLEILDKCGFISLSKPPDKLIYFVSEMKIIRLKNIPKDIQIGKCEHFVNQSFYKWFIDKDEYFKN